jgi:hypothetical protein
MALSRPGFLQSVALGAAGSTPVIVKGRILKRSGQLLGVDLKRINAMAAASRDAVIAAAGSRTAA